MIEYASGLCGPVDEPQPRKSMAIQQKSAERFDVTWEKVRDEPPQKCRNMRTGPWSPEIVTFRVVSRVRRKVLVCDILVIWNLCGLKASEIWCEGLGD